MIKNQFKDWTLDKYGLRLVENLLQKDFEKNAVVNIERALRDCKNGDTKYVRLTTNARLKIDECVFF